MVAAQLGREPKARFRVASRCSYGHPTVIANAPRCEDGTPFPTLYWLTCPHLVEAVSACESAGAAERWMERIRSDAHLRFEVLASDQQYRAAREMEGRGDDPCAGVGIAGQDDPCATKCLHAHVATYLAGIPDPLGRRTLDSVRLECESDRCCVLLAQCQSSA
jgi:hypothetical protein